MRRTPATYDRILKHIAGHEITVHCTVTRQQVQRDGYLEEFVRFWSAQRRRRADLGEPLHAAGRRGLRRAPAAGRSRARRRRPDGAAAALSRSCGCPKGLIEVYAKPPRVARTSASSRARRRCISADLETQITPCQFGGNPDCAQLRLHRVGRARRGRPAPAARACIPVGAIFEHGSVEGRRAASAGCDPAACRRAEPEW